MHPIKFTFFLVFEISWFLLLKNLPDIPLRIWKAHNQTRNGAKTEAKTTLEILYKKVRPIFSDSSFVFRYTKGHQKTLRACARALPSSCHQIGVFYGGWRCLLGDYWASLRGPRASELHQEPYFGYQPLDLPKDIKSVQYHVRDSTLSHWYERIESRTDWMAFRIPSGWFWPKNITSDHVQTPVGHAGMPSNPPDHTRAARTTPVPLEVKVDESGWPPEIDPPPQTGCSGTMFI